LAAKFFKKANEASARNQRIREIVLDHELLTTDGIENEPENAPPETSPSRTDAGAAAGEM
jgi:hypothetical protein